MIQLYSPSQNINSIQNSLNSQHSNAIYTSKPLSKLISAMNSSRKRNIEELKIEPQDNGKCAFNIYLYDYI